MSATSCQCGNDYGLSRYIGLSYVFDPGLEECKHYVPDPGKKSHEQAYRDSKCEFTILSILGLLPIFAAIYRLHKARNGLEKGHYADKNFWRVQTIRGASEFMGLGALWFIADLIALSIIKLSST